MAKRDGSSGRDPESSGNSNMLWYLAIFGVAVLFFAVYYMQQQGDEIGYTELVSLIQRSKRDDKADSEPANPAGAFVETDEEKRTVRYTNLRDVKVAPDRVEGMVDRTIIPKDGSEPTGPKKTKFITYKNEQMKIDEILDKSNIPFAGQPPPGVMEKYGPVVLLTALLFLVFFIMIRRLGGAGSAMAFGRSRGKLYAQEDLGVTFDDAAGIDEAVDEVREVVDFLKSPEKYQTLGGRIPKGVLLVGPPGTGKTLLAKAIAGEADVPFFSLSGSDFVEMFVGVGAARVRDMFQQAEAKAPCIIFIDELDALGKTRGNSVVGGHDEREQTLNALLVEMDGFESNSGIIVIAATNRPETLDPALLRPGRFDRHVLVDRPDVRGREAILKVHVQNVKLDPSVDLKHIASITSGFVGADLANLVNEAALLAAREGRTSVSMKEFDDAVERVTAGLEKRDRVIHHEEKQRVAYHESGHALVAYSLPNTDPVHKVSIIPRGIAALGYTMQRPEGDRYLLTQGELESRIQVLMGGTIAEEIIYNEVSTGAQNDLERATEIARSMVMEYGMSRMGRVNYRDSGRSVFLSSSPDEVARRFSEQTAREIDQEIHRIINESIEKVRHILDHRRPALEALAERLIEVESIDAEVLREIIERTSPGPSIVPGTGDIPSRPLGDAEAPAKADKPVADAGG